jgi:biopolymer transport protein ExbD
MDLNRLRSLLAAPVAALFLILVLCVFGVQRPPSVGFRIPMIRIHHNPQEISCDGRFEFLRLTRDGRTWINEAEIPVEQLRQKVAALMEDRAERVVFVIVDSDLSYGQFTAFLDRIEGSADGLHVVVVSGEIRREFERPRVLANPSMTHETEQEPPNVCDFIYP